MSANKFFVSELSQYKKMVRQCITVSVFILVINCLLSTWPCLSLFHSSLELPHFYVTWVDDERNVTETPRGVPAPPGQRCRARGESRSVFLLVQRPQPCLLLLGDGALPCPAPLASLAEHQLLQSGCGGLSNFLPKSVKDSGLWLFSGYHELSHGISCHH